MAVRKAPLGVYYPPVLVLLLLAAGAAAQSSYYRFQTSGIPPCPFLSSPEVTVSSEAELNLLLSQVDASYFSPQQMCEVRVALVPSSTPYRLRSTITISGISFQMRSSDPAVGKPTIIGPDGRRAFVLLTSYFSKGDKPTQMKLSDIKLGHPDCIASAAAFFAGKKGYAAYAALAMERKINQRAEDGYTAPWSLDEDDSAVQSNPLFKSTLLNGTWLGSNLGASGRNEKLYRPQQVPQADGTVATVPRSTCIYLGDDDKMGVEGWGEQRLLDVATGVGLSSIIAPSKVDEALYGPGRYSLTVTGRFSDGSSRSSYVPVGDVDGDGFPDYARVSAPTGRFSGGAPVDAVSFDYEVKSPRDVASGQATGRRSSAPRDCASGLATGRRNGIIHRDLAARHMGGLSHVTDATDRLRRSMSVVFFDRDDSSVLRGPYVGDSPTDNIDLGDAGATTGAFVFVSNATLLLVGCDFDGGTALLGGALHVSQGSVARVEGCSFSRCSAFEEGGAVYADGSSLVSLSSSKFDACTADNGGAVAAAEGSRVLASSCTFTNNIGRGCGGAVSLDDQGSMLYAESCTLHNNRAENGGGVCVGRLSLADFGFSRFSSSQARSSGGAIFSEPASITRVAGCVFSSSSAFFGPDIYSYGRLPYISVYRSQSLSVEGVVRPSSPPIFQPDDSELTTKVPPPVV